MPKSPVHTEEALAHTHTHTHTHHPKAIIDERGKLELIRRSGRAEQKLSRPAGHAEEEREMKEKKEEGVHHAGRQEKEVSLSLTHRGHPGAKEALPTPHLPPLAVNV